MKTVTSLLLLVMMIASCIEGRAVVDKYSPVFYRETRLITDYVDRATSRRTCKLTSTQIRQIVDHHNQLRAAEGASNMEKMRWNSKLAELAQKWADRCEFEHGQPQHDPATVGYEQIGQNLYMNSDLSKGVRDGVQAWFDEKSDYNYDSDTCAAGKQCGHYTQIVWGKTKEVGCGLKRCASIHGLRNANYLVCNYGPPGNWNGEKPFKKGASCSECDSGKFFCSNGLCDSSCSSVGQGSTCRCAAQCRNGATKTNDCKCRCKPGWTGVACNEECRDKHKYCGANPGWPKAMCDRDKYVLEHCPKLCGRCQAAGEAPSEPENEPKPTGEPSGEPTGKPSGEPSGEPACRSHTDDDKTLRQQQQQQQSLIDAISKLMMKK